MTTADVTLVIGNYEGAEFLAGCIESARAQTRRPVEIIVVDGSSTDNSCGIAANLGARVVRVPNRGLAFLYNRGVEAAETEYVLLSNTDVVYDRYCFERLVDAVDADPSVFAADAHQRDWTDGSDVHAHTTLRRGTLLGEYFPGLHLDHVVPAETSRPTVAAHGAAMLVRRSLFEELGGFDETFFLDFEDLDLCWRAWLQGHASVYVPDACLRHYVGGVTSAGVLPRRLASSHHNVMRFALKCLPARAAVLVVLGELARFPRHRRAIGSALIGTLRELPEIVRERRRIRPRADLLEWMLAGQPLP